MAFTRPTLAELVTRIRGDFRSRLEISGSLLRRAMADVLAVVWAGAVHLLHGHLEWLGRQLFPATSDRDYLLSQAAMYGITPTPATYATGTVTATGVDTTVIPLGTILVRDDGVTYTTDAEATIGSTTTGEVTVAVTAVDAGADGNMAAAEILSFESPITDVDSAVTVDADADGDGLAGGVDEEDTDGTRSRLLLRLREPPQGGATQDYEAWALAVAGVTRAWVYENENGLGTVVVRFVLDGEVDIFPGAGVVSDVQDALDAERPVTAEVTAEAPTQLDVDFTITVTPDTTAVRAAVEAELEDLLVREAEPGDGAGRGTILLSKMLGAISVAAGVEDFSLTSPAADVVPATGELAVLGTITWL